MSARIAGEFQIPGHPARSPRYPADNDSAAPLPGEHNYAILVDLSGKSDEEIASLTTAGILQSKNV